MDLHARIKELEADNHRLQQGLDYTYKKLQETKESEQRFKLIADHITELAVLLNPFGLLQYVSPSHEQVLGYPPEEMLHMDASQFIHPEDLEAFIALAMSLLETKTSAHTTVRLVGKEGNIVWLEATLDAVLDPEGGLRYILCHGIDISERQLVEKAWLQSEERYQLLVEQCPFPIVLQKGERIAFANPAAYDLVGMMPDEPVEGRLITEFVHPEDLGMLFEAIQKDARVVQYRLIDGKGDIHFVEATGITLQENDYLVILQDVTTRKKIEAIMKESEQYYRRLVELSPIPIGSHRNDELLFLNPAGLSLFGVDNLDEIVGINVFEYLNGESLEIGRAFKAALIRGEPHPPTELSLRTLKGDEFIVEAVGNYDQLTDTVHFMFHNVTERREAEIALRESEDRYRRLVELSPEPVLVHYRGIILYCNQAGLALLGCETSGMLVGRSIIDFVHPDYIEQVLNQNLKIEQGLTVGLEEQKLIRSDGEVVIVDAVSGPVRYTGHQAVLVCLRNVTERRRAEQFRKEAEKELRLSEDRYFRLQNSLDRFSRDVFGVLNVERLEKRLLEEVSKLLGTSHVSVVSWDGVSRPVTRMGDATLIESLQEEIRPLLTPLLTPNELIPLQRGWTIQIGENRGKTLLLCIGGTGWLNHYAKHVWLRTLTRYVNVLYDNFRVIEDLSVEMEELANSPTAPPWLLRMFFNLSESERKRLSQDLHDSALQEQISWYRRLDLLNLSTELPEASRQEISMIMEGLLDVIYQIRSTCNELRPPLLSEMGLVPSLQSMFDILQLRHDFVIEFESSLGEEHLSDELSLCLYRVIQELLANAAKHAQANRIELSLCIHEGILYLEYRDNGIGADSEQLKGGFQSMGVYGIRQRIRSMEGAVQFLTSPNEGLRVCVSIPTIQQWNVYLE